MGLRHPIRRLFTTVHLAIIALAGACDRAPVGPVRTGSVTLPAQITIDTGERRQLQLEYRDATGRLVPRSAEWTSSDEGIASVDDGGMVRGRNSGVAIIIARVDDVADTTRVTVKELPHGSFLRLRPDSAEILAGTRFPLFAHSPGVGAGSHTWPPGALEWTSSNTAVARVDSLGVVEGVAPGSVVIGVAGGGRRDAVRLTVRPSVAYSRISAGSNHTCAVSTTGDALCWGLTDYGAVGVRTAPRYCNQYGCALTPAHSPLPVRTGLEFESVVASPGYDYYMHSCGLDAAGQAFCWGNNYHGQLGTSSGYAGCAQAISPPPCSFAPLAVGLTVPFQAIGAGHGYSCGLASAGEVYCWGWNYRGQAGQVGDYGSVAPARIATEQRFAALSVGDLHSCALDSQGAAFCWGDNRHGQLGIGAADTIVRATPVRAGGELRFSAIHAGNAITCGVTTDGDTHCWGNDPGGLITGADVSRARNLVFRSVTVAGRHACGVTESGAAYCWGSNASGELGSGAVEGTAVRAEPTLVAGDHRWRTLSAGSDFTCGVTTQDQGFCWGSNVKGKLGIGSDVSSRAEPTRVAGQGPPRS